MLIDPISGTIWYKLLLKVITYLLIKIIITTNLLHQPMLYILCKAPKDGMNIIYIFLHLSPDYVTLYGQFSHLIRRALTRREIIKLWAFKKWREKHLQLTNAGLIKYLQVIVEGQEEWVFFMFNSRRKRRFLRNHVMSVDFGILRLHPQKKKKKHPPKNCIWFKELWERKVCPFTVFTPRFIHIWNSRACYGPINRLNGPVWKLSVLDSNTWNPVSLLRLFV